jgi:putative endonuclease
MYYIYLARCNDNSLYTGSCKNITNREIKHNKGEGAQYTKQRRPIKIIYYEEYDTLFEAIKREKQIKKWSRIKKENLIKYGHPTKF